MAIEYEIQLPDGSRPRYVRIIKVSYDLAPPKHYAESGVQVLASVEVGFYQTEELRREGFYPSYRHTFHLAIGPEIKEVNLPGLYEHIEREGLISQVFTPETGITDPAEEVPATPPALPPLPPMPSQSESVPPLT